MAAASKELRRLQHTIRQLKEESSESALNDTRRQVEQLQWAIDEQKLQLNKNLNMEKARCLDYENKCVMLERQIKKLEQERTGALRLSDILQVSHSKAWCGCTRM